MTACAGGQSDFNEGITPNLDWVPLKEAAMRDASGSSRKPPDFKRRLAAWRRRRRLKVLAIISSYIALFLLVFTVSLLFFAGMGMTQEQHLRFKDYVVNRLSSIGGHREPLLPKMFNEQKDLYILLVGLDEEPPHRSDSVLVAHIDLVSYETRLLSIPRDLRVSMHSKNGHEVKDKLAHSYVYGGIDDVKYAVSQLLGVPVDYYIVIKIEGMIQFIDELGGVEIDVEKNMHYRDRAQNLDIDLRKGRQVLNGDDAVDYGRFRKDVEGDNGRMHRQQILIKAILVELRKPINLLRIDRLIEDLFKTVETNIELVQFMALKDVAKEFTPEKIQSMTLFTDSTEDDGISYQFVKDEDMIAAQTFLDNLLPAPPPGETSDEGAGKGANDDANVKPAGEQENGVGAEPGAAADGW